MSRSSIMATALLLGAAGISSGRAQVIERNPDSYATPQWSNPREFAQPQGGPDPFYKRVKKARQAKKQADKSRKRNRK